MKRVSGAGTYQNKKPLLTQWKGYRYLAILDLHDLLARQMKKLITVTYVKRLLLLLKTTLNALNCTGRVGERLKGQIKSNKLWTERKDHSFLGFF